MPQLTQEVLRQIRDRAVACLIDLSEKIGAGWYPTAEFAEALAALEALPLTTAEMATHRNRLENARSYLDGNELGAACVELRLIHRSLANR